MSDNVHDDHRKLFQQTRDPLVEAATYRYHGLERFQQGDCKKARALLERARTLFEQHGDQKNAGHLHLEIAWVDIAEGRHAEASRNLHAAQRLAVEAGDQALFVLAATASIPKREAA